MSAVNYRLVFLSLFAAAAVGCMGGYSPPPSFTSGWTDEVERYESRNPPKPEGIQVTEDTKIVVDEEGKPRLMIGEGRVSADVRVDGGDAEVGLKYKGGWGEPRRMPRPK